MFLAEPLEMRHSPEVFTSMFHSRMFHLLFTCFITSNLIFITYLLWKYWFWDSIVYLYGLIIDLGVNDIYAVKNHPSFLMLLPTLHTYVYKSRMRCNFVKNPLVSDTNTRSNQNKYLRQINKKEHKSTVRNW